MAAQMVRTGEMISTKERSQLWMEKTMKGVTDRDSEGAVLQEAMEDMENSMGAIQAQQSNSFCK